MAPPIERDDAVFLDFDGTLVDVAADPERVKVGRRLPDLLKGVSTRLGGAVAVVSGRPLADLTRLLYPFEGPAAGIHGLERRTAIGTIIRPAPDPSIAGVRPMLERFAAATPGVALEDKGLALALHIRSKPEQVSACLQVARDAARMADHRLSVTKGKMVIELHPREPNKGHAILTFLGEAPFRARRPLFAGDDGTDDGGFAMVNRLGGVSIQIGPRNRSAALFRLPDVAAVIAWLSEFARPAPTARPPSHAAP